MAPTALDALVAIDELRQDLDVFEANALTAARAARWTWAEIGAGIGLSRQAAWKRYGRRLSSTTGQEGQGRPQAGVAHP